MIVFRPATNSDVLAITDIYNEVILNTTSTFDLEPKTIEERSRWLDDHGDKHPVLVAQSGEEVVGWAALSRWSDKQAYEATAEISVYVHKDHRNKGIGKKLTELVTLAGQEAGLHSVISRITEGNEVSINLHVALGFKHVGVMKEAGHKFGRYLDVYLLQKVFTS